MSSPIVRCRPERAQWLGVAFFGLIGGPPVLWALFGWDLDPGSRWLQAIIGSLLLVPTLVYAVWLARAQVVADTGGLRWRSLGGWTSAPWVEISDYYDRPHSANAVLMVVEAPNATLSWLASTRAPAVLSLRRLIAQRATRAAATTWAILGTRPDEPRSLTFAYRASDLRIMAIIMWTCVIGWTGMWVYLTGLGAIRKLPETLGQMGWLLGLLGAVVFIGFPLLLPALALPGFLALRETRRRRHQRIRADARGLCFEDGSRRLEVNWDGVMDYFYSPFPGVTGGSRHVVVTRAGTFDFTAHLHDLPILKRMIAHYAKNTPGPDWQPRAEEVLGGDALRWTRGPQGDRERVYRYRTPTNRALLWLPTALTLMLILLPSVLREASLDPPDDSSMWLAWVPGALSLWGWWRYFHASVRISGRGISQTIPFGRRFIPWTEVREYRHIGDGSKLAVVSDRSSIRFWGGLADVEELKEEIAQRAVHSPRGGWRTR